MTFGENASAYSAFGSTSVTVSTGYAVGYLQTLSSQPSLTVGTTMYFLFIQKFRQRDGLLYAVHGKCSGQSWYTYLVQTDSASAISQPVALGAEATYYFVMAVSIPQTASNLSSTTFRLTVKDQSGAGTNDSWPSSLVNDDVASATMTAIVNINANNSPGTISFRVFATSISVTLAPNGNPAGTTLTMTTGSFETSASSSAAITGGYISLMMTGLAANTTTFVNARAVGVVTSTTTLVASTVTQAVAPGAGSFVSVSTNSMNVSWLPNNNSLVPPTSYRCRFPQMRILVCSLRAKHFNQRQQCGSDCEYELLFQSARVRAGGNVTDFNTAAATYTLAIPPSLNSPNFAVSDWA